MAIDLASMLFGGGPNGAQAQDPNKAAMSALAAQLLMGSGPQQQRTTFGQHIGAGLQAGMTAKNDALQQQTRNQFMQAQIQAMMSKKQERGRLVSVVGPDGKPTLKYEADAEGLTPYNSPLADNTPSDLRIFEAVKNMPPEDRELFFQVKRNPVSDKLAQIGGGYVWADPTNHSITPISTLQTEADAARRKKEAEARGTAEGEAWGAMAKKGINALNVIETVQLAEPLIDVATGSGGGAAADKIAAFFGESLEGDKAIAQLKIIQANLMTNMPRMEGPQSDRDVELYREAAGQLGDATVPRGRKKAALKMILAMQEKYADMAPTAPGSSPAKPAVRRFNPQTGKIE
jgi:hypothetical protein